MIASIAAEGQRGGRTLRQGVVQLAQERPEIVGLTGDLAKQPDLHLFAQAYPDRFSEMGMAEQRSDGAAGGMAKEGLVVRDHLCRSAPAMRLRFHSSGAIAEEGLDVKICCALPGLTTGYGPSHQATDDLAMMRAVLGLTVVDPCDALDIEQAAPQIAEHRGPVYMRLLRGNVPLVLDEHDYCFELGRAKLLRDGADVLAISSGILTMRALETAQALAADRVDVAVLHCPTIKPLDEQTIVDAAERA
ncbi:MAG: transketolase C-terminal domain-containing protein [Burkholderiaceae bacterium]